MKLQKHKANDNETSGLKRVVSLVLLSGTKGIP